MFKNNFIKLCSQKGESPSFVCGKIGITPAAFSQWTDTTVPRKVTLQRIADYFGVTPDYLLREDDDQTTSGNSQQLSQDGVYLAPLYESVSAGFGAFAESQIIDHIPIYVTKKAEAEQTICIRVRGDSMAPVICDGDIVQVRKQDSVISGSVAVVMVEDEGFVKGVYYEEGKWLELRSENPDYPPIHFEGSSIDKVRIVGFVTKVIRDVNRHITNPIPQSDDSKQRLNDLLNGLDEKQLEQLLAFADAFINIKK